MFSKRVQLARHHITIHSLLNWDIPSEQEKAELLRNPYICEEKDCHRRFSAPSKLAKHKHIAHSTLPRYACEDAKCKEKDTRFWKWSELRKHCADEHPKTRKRKISTCSVKDHSDVVVAHYSCEYPGCEKSYTLVKS